MAKKVESGLAEVLAENQKLTAEDCCTYYGPTGLIEINKKNIF